MVRLASSLKRVLLEPRSRGHCGDSLLKGGAHHNDMLGWEGGEGVCEGRLRAETASGYPRKRVRGGVGLIPWKQVTTRLSPSAFTSSSTPYFNFSFAYFLASCEALS